MSANERGNYLRSIVYLLEQYAVSPDPTRTTLQVEELTAKYLREVKSNLDNLELVEKLKVIGSRLAKMRR